MKQKPVHPAIGPWLEGKMLLVDKPLGWTSFDVVKKIRIATGISRIGHAGTLDPLASGLLIICLGRFTKRINGYMGMEKEYTGSITFGYSTPTYDLESSPSPVADASSLTDASIRAAALQFTGAIMQVPPAHSAIKIDGKPVYLAARKGREVELEPRPVTIREFDISLDPVDNSATVEEACRIAASRGRDRVIAPSSPVTANFRVVCTTGTYIRSLAHDLGKLLGTGAYLSSLVRTRIGEFRLENAQSVEEVIAEVRRMTGA